MTIGRFVGFRSAIGACAVIAVLMPSGPANARDLASSGTLKATTDAGDACRATLPVTVHAPDASAFTGDRKELQKLIGGLRLMLGFECGGTVEPSVLTITGLVGDEAVYRGAAEAASRWALVDLPEPSQETPAAAVTVAAAPVHRCDTLAAHPDDPDKASAVAGVTDTALETEAAFDACLQAVGAFPEEPRFAFQLGRTLMLGGAQDEAVGFLSDAAAGGSAAALAYLGDLEDDTENALELYRAAAEGGFKPASALVTALESQAGTLEASAGDPGAACDALAAHPDDPAKPAKVAGITDEALDSLAATEACIQAVAVDPDNARTRFQLGRALYLGDLKPEATQELKLASDGGSAAAMAYLAELTDDDGEAERLVQASANAGFKPAVAAMAAFNAAREVDTREEVITNQEYFHPDRLEHMTTGKKFSVKGQDFVVTAIYGRFLLNGIATVCPDLDLEISEDQIIAVFNHEAGFFVAADAGTDLTNGRYDTLMQEAVDDGYLLASSKGCKSKETVNVRKSLSRTFLIDLNASQSPEDCKRNIFALSAQEQMRQQTLCDMKMNRFPKESGD